MNKDWTVNGIYSVTFETVCISRCDRRFFFFFFVFFFVFFFWAKK